MGAALQTMDELKGSFDFVFLDADKINYPKYYETVLPRLNEGGLIVIDNVFWDGQVLTNESEKAEAIDQLNEMIMADEHVEQVMLPVRDGITIVRKKRKA